MIDTFKKDEVYFSAAALLVARTADNLKRIGDSGQLALWLGIVPHDVLVENFWPYLVNEFDKLNPYRDYRADIIHENHCTGIKVTFITHSALKGIDEETRRRRGL